MMYMLVDEGIPSSFGYFGFFHNLLVLCNPQDKVMMVKIHEIREHRGKLLDFDKQYVEKVYLKTLNRVSITHKTWTSLKNKTFTVTVSELHVNKCTQGLLITYVFFLVCLIIRMGKTTGYLPPLF